MRFFLQSIQDELKGNLCGQMRGKVRDFFNRTEKNAG